MKRPIVLVHGGWHGGWCWKPLVPQLRAAGHRVTRPTLTGVGERAHLASAAVKLDTHIEDVVRHIENEELEGVVLVGHSYSGMVITGVAHRIPERLAALVYLDAFVPENGRSLLDYVVPERAAAIAAQAAATGMVECMPLHLLGLHREEDIQWVARRVTPQPGATFTQPVRLDPAAAARVAALPHTFIYCSSPATGSFDRFAERFRADPQWRFAELKTGHDAMISDPDGVARILLAAAAEAAA